jgi:hypothetical protein
MISRDDVQGVNRSPVVIKGVGPVVMAATNHLRTKGRYDFCFGASIIPEFGKFGRFGPVVKQEKVRLRRKVLHLVNFLLFVIGKTFGAEMPMLDGVDDLRP